MTSTPLQRVPLRELLRPARREETPEPGRLYRLIGVQLWGRGVYEREALDGADTRYKKLSRVQRGDVVVNKIWARNGSVGVVPPELDGCFATTEFPVFEPVDDVNSQWFHWLVKTRWFWQQCDVKSRGTSGKNRIRPEAFLDIAIPLPSPESRETVLRSVESCQAVHARAIQLRETADRFSGSLFSALLGRCWRDSADWETVPLDDVTRPVSGLVDPQDPQYRELPHLNGEAIESATGRLLSYRTAAEDEIKSGKYLFSAGAVLYSKIRPYLRKAVQVPVDGLCSADIYAFEEFAPDVDPRFFMYSLLSPQFTDYAVRLSGRTRMPKLNQKQLAAYPLPIPEMATQREIVATLDAAHSKLQEVRANQGRIGTLLESLGRALLATGLGLRGEATAEAIGA
jgi:type I restriction enzyme, S subunit